MKVWKFMIGNEYRALKSDPDTAFKNCLALAIAATKDDALAYLQRFAAENAIDARWLEVADVKCLPLEAGVLGWSEQ